MAKRAIALDHLPDEQHPLFFRAGTLVFTPNGLAPPEKKAPYEEWEHAGAIFAVNHHGEAFAVGDWLRYGEANYGEKAAQAIDAHHWKPQTLKVYRWVSERIAPPARRMDRLTIRHHLAVAALAPSKQRTWLTRAAADNEEEPWTVKRLVEAIRQGKDPVVTGWFLVVTCTNEKDQMTLQKKLETEGRTVRLSVRRQYGDAD